MNTVAEFGSGQVLWDMLWFFLFFIWIWILITVFADIFRSNDLGGWGKALWIIFVIVLPYLGVFVYLIALAKPPMSWLRKMSTNTMISSQIQMMNRKKYSIVRKKSRIGYW